MQDKDLYEALEKKALEFEQKARQIRQAIETLKELEAINYTPVVKIKEPKENYGLSAWEQVEKALTETGASSVANIHKYFKTHFPKAPNSDITSLANTVRRFANEGKLNKLPMPNRNGHFIYSLKKKEAE